jgi:hypothetical protein
VAQAVEHLSSKGMTLSLCSNLGPTKKKKKREKVPGPLTSVLSHVHLQILLSVPIIKEEQKSQAVGFFLGFFFLFLGGGRAECYWGLNSEPHARLSFEPLCQPTVGFLV